MPTSHLRLSTFPCLSSCLVSEFVQLPFFADIRTKILQPSDMDRDTVVLQCAILGVLSHPVSWIELLVISHHVQCENNH